MIVTPFGGLSLFINMSILALRFLSRSVLWIRPRYAVQEEHRFFFSLFIMILTSVVVLTSAAMVLYSSLESPYSNLRLLSQIHYPALPEIEPSHFFSDIESIALGR